jgi:intergrase/recombinase
MSTNLSLKEALERRGEKSNERGSHSALPPISFILRAEAILRPVEVARLLVLSGLRLKEAHDILERISAGERVPVELRGNKAETIASELKKLGVSSSTHQNSDG